MLLNTDRGIFSYICQFSSPQNKAVLKGKKKKKLSSIILGCVQMCEKGRDKLISIENWHFTCLALCVVGPIDAAKDLRLG